MIIFDAKSERGKVYLVGAGPGDPELLTLKAWRVLRECNVVVYDALVNYKILERIPENVERIFVGEPRKEFRLSQDEINRLLIDKAISGKIVARLKGGDPFVFGRGGEEALALADAGIEWEVVPGVSAGLAVPAYAGIPITHRDHASSVAFVTGHEQQDKDTGVNWHALAEAVDTIVIFMCAKTLPDIVNKLLSAGKNQNTPIAIIQYGTLKQQKVIKATLSTILKRIKKTPLQSPALAVVGEVVEFHDKLSWFPNKDAPGQEGFYRITGGCLKRSATPQISL